MPELKNNKGSREKKMAIDYKEDRISMFKYQSEKYNTSEACSEKLSYEIARVLKYDCAKIELAIDKSGKLGILNYLFVDLDKSEHIDADAFIKKGENDRKKFYNLENIKMCLDKLNKNLYFDFLKIMFFDALIGEQDRHEENWGVTVNKGEYKISPLYDNGCNLLRNFKDEKYAEKYYNNECLFEKYINRSKSLIYKKNGQKYGHFELIEDVYEEYPEFIQNEVLKLNILSENIV
ncbi:MAG: HipA domain-containing protein, partial [Clostridia bacterium]|nr:HipA domain-containing protein [Clostridia bacterium]